MLISFQAMAEADYLWVDVTLNGSPQGVLLIALDTHQHRTWASSDRLDEILADASYKRVVSSFDGDSFTNLDSISGLDYQLDTQAASLSLRIDPKLLPLNAIQFGRRATQRAERGHGGHLNYDFLATSSDFRRLNQLNGFLEPVYFNRLGALRNTIRVTLGDFVASRAVRLDSTWTMDIESLGSRLQFGDYLSAKDLFGSRYRMAGLRFARDFSMTPLEPTYDIPEFYGVSEVPSNVELFIDGVRRAQVQAPPGPFRIDQAPVLTGAGEATLVVTNALGEQVVQTFNYYLDPQLLRQGLWDYDFAVGWLRNGYGMDDFDYGAFNAVGSFRFGINDGVTLEWNGRGSESMTSSELRARYKVFDWPMTATTGLGVIREQGARSKFLARIGSNLRNKAFFANAEAVFVDAQARAQEGLPFQRQIVGGAGYGFAKWKLSYNLLHRQRSRADVFTRHSVRLSRSANLSFGHVHLAAGISRTLDSQNDHSSALQFSISWTPRPDHFLSIRDQQLSDHRLETSYQYRATGDLGLSAYLAHQMRDRENRWNAGFQKNFSQGQLRGRIDNAFNGDGESVQLGTRGAIGIMHGHFFAARSLGSAYALVDLDGQKDLPVYMNHRAVARTNARGLAVLPNLLPYQENKITTNPLDFSLDVYPADQDLVSVPAADTGIYLRFEIHDSKGFEFTLMRTPFDSVPAGAVVVSEEDSRRFFVGDKGRAYLEQEIDKVTYQAFWRDESCRFTIDIANITDDAQPDIGKILCH